MNQAFRILLVEDERIELCALVKMLHSTKIEIESVETAENGFVALEKYKQLNPNVVIIDINMPGMSGLEAIRKMKEFSDNARFVIVSAYNLFNYAQEALRLNVSDFLVKPITVIDIERVFASFIAEDESNSQSQQQAKLLKIRPLLESDCILAISSMRFDTPLETMFDFLDVPVASGCVVVMSADACGRALIERVKTWLNTSPLICFADIVKGVGIFAILSSRSGLTTDTINQALLHATVQGNYNKEHLHFGIGTVVNNITDLPVSYEKALLAMQQAILCNQSIVISGINDDCSTVQNNFDDRQYADEITRSIILGDEDKILQNTSAYLNAAQTTFSPQELFSHIYWLYMMIHQNIYGEECVDRSLANAILLSPNMNALKEMLLSSFREMADVQSGSETLKGIQAVEAAKKTIRERYKSSLTLEDIAREQNYSFYHLGRLFKKRTGYSFSEYLTRIRLENAKKLLLSEDNSVKEVAYKVGFHSQGYFAKVFKKYTNIAPSEWRDHCLENGNKN